MSNVGSATSGMLLGAAAVVTLALTLIAARSAVRAGDRRLWLLAAAFAALTLKGAVSALSILFHDQPWAMPHGRLELVGAALDLAAVVLLAVPLLVRK